MKVCIIGDGLVGLTLANMLIRKELSVDVLTTNKFKKYNNSRTLGISKSNIDFFNNNILKIEKIAWKINNIKVYTENFPNNEIFDFVNKKKRIFSIIKNKDLIELLKNKLKKSKIIKFKKNLTYKNIIKKNYKLIINCNPNHEITKKFFSNKIQKKYNSKAYSTIIDHKKIKQNNTAIQIFTKSGPIAFLPMSKNQTSVVYSFRSIYNENENVIKKLIKKFNPKYEIKNINNFSKFELSSVNLRNYYKDNILAFGDLLHKIHPLAGQGFNMSLRDIKVLSKLIDDKIKMGLDLDESICSEFQKKTKDKNLIFSTGIDWIYEFFKFESKINNQLLSKTLNVIGKNKSFNSLFKKFADNGLGI